MDYEAPVDSAEDIVNRDDIYRAHFCGSKKKKARKASGFIHSIKCLKE